MFAVSQYNLSLVRSRSIDPKSPLLSSGQILGDMIWSTPVLLVNCHGQHHGAGTGTVELSCQMLISKLVKIVKLLILIEMVVSLSV